MWLFNVLEALYCLVNLLLVAFGLHYWYLTWQYWIEKARTEDEIQYMKKNPQYSHVSAAPPSVMVYRDDNYTLHAGPQFEWPTVTLQLPIFNEGPVAKRLIASCLKLDYPADKLEIQVLDDSIDGTPLIVQQALKEFAPLRFPVHHVRRSNREGYKAGALQAGLELTTADFVAIFDADFEAQPQYLRDMIPHFYDTDYSAKSQYYKSGLGRKGVCCVQARWGFTNRDFSLLTKLQAVAIDGHFLIEQTSRCQGGFLLNFNGTGGIWRRSAIEDAGGWAHDTLAEDLDLSYRAQFVGWQIRYVVDVVAPSEVPPSIAAFKKQQQRWAKGTMQCFRKHFRNVWTVPGLTFRQRVECTFHLSGYFINLLMTISLVLTFPLFIWFESELVELLREIAPIMMLVAIGPTVLYISAQISNDQPSPKRLLLLPTLVLLGYGLCFSNSKAVIDGMYLTGGKFERTEKFGLDDKSRNVESFFTHANSVVEKSLSTADISDLDTGDLKDAEEDVSGADTSKVYPRVEIMCLVSILVAWSPRLFMVNTHEYYVSGGDMWVLIYTLSAVLMIAFGMQDVAALTAHHKSRSKSSTKV